ncbi:MAG: head GIN domain-containing protein [Caldilineaceae bacterium]
MKRSSKWFILLTGVTSGLLLAACAFGPLRVIVGSGKVVSQEMDLSDFERVNVGSAFQVEIRHDDGYRVTIEVDENVLPHLRVVKEGNTLQIGLERGVTLSGNVTLRGVVSLPALTGVEASGASRVTLSGFRGTADLTLRASGASQLTGEIDGDNADFVASGASEIQLQSTVKNASIEATGASKITLSGGGQNLTITASGASPVDLAKFPAQDAKIDASGASNVTVQLTGTLDAKASGASHVYYLGSPTLGRVNTSGASSINQR